MALIRQSSLVYLGDLLRYRNRIGQEVRPYLTNDSVDMWAEERIKQVYLQAAYICPPNGRGHGRMALMCRIQEDIPGTLYWSFLSMVKPQPSPLGSECILSVRKQIQKGLGEGQWGGYDMLRRVILRMCQLQCDLFSHDLSHCSQTRIEQDIVSSYQVGIKQVEELARNSKRHDRNDENVGEKEIGEREGEEGEGEEEGDDDDDDDEKEEEAHGMSISEHFSALFKILVTLQASLTFWREQSFSEFLFPPFTLSNHSQIFSLFPSALSSSSFSPPCSLFSFG